MTRLLTIAVLFALVGCASVESSSRSESSISECSEEHLQSLEQKKEESMKALDEAFSDLDRNPTEENRRKKDVAALTAATAASDLAYVHANCTGSSGNGL